MTSELSVADGLFGPGSVTWRILGEPVLWVGGLRAMYLQALHPRTIRATWQNTAFARPGEAWGRFGRTVEFVRVRTYGTTAEVARAGRRVQKVHASLTGTDADGSVIRLDEPELLLWVHCGEIASYADVARRSGLRLSEDDLDRFVAEQRRSAAVVGLDPATQCAGIRQLAALGKADVRCPGHPGHRPEHHDDAQDLAPGNDAHPAPAARNAARHHAARHRCLTLSSRAQGTSAMAVKLIWHAGRLDHADRVLVPPSATDRT